MAASGIITDVDQFTEPVRAPADGDPANGETFQDGLQDLANRTRNLKNRVDTIISERMVAEYSATGGGVPGTAFALTEVEATVGFDLITNQVKVPKTGLWLVRFEAQLDTTSFGAGSAGVAILKAGIAVWSRRITVVSGDSWPSVSLTKLVRVADRDVDLISVASALAATELLDTAGYYSLLHIERVAD